MTESWSSLFPNLRPGTGCITMSYRNGLADRILDGNFWNLSFHLQEVAEDLQALLALPAVTITPGEQHWAGGRPVPLLHAVAPPHQIEPTSQHTLLAPLLGPFSEAPAPARGLGPSQGRMCPLSWLLRRGPGSPIRDPEGSTRLAPAFRDTLEPGDLGK